MEHFLDIPSCEEFKRKLNGKNSIKLFYKCPPVIIKCEIDNLKLSLSYATGLSVSNDLKFEEVGLLDSISECSSWNVDIFAKQSINLNSFKFYLLLKNDLNCKVNSIFKECPKLKQELFDVIFGKLNDHFKPVLLIATLDGVLYWKSLDSNVKRFNDNVIFSVSSSIILINSFKCLPAKNPIDTLFKSKSSRQSLNDKDTSDNCLFVLTNTGKCYIHSFIEEYSYRVAILPHYINHALKFNLNNNKNKTYLIYVNNNQNVYSFKIENLLKEITIKPKSLRSDLRCRKILSKINYSRCPSVFYTCIIQKYQIYPKLLRPEIQFKRNENTLILTRQCKF